MNLQQSCLHSAIEYDLKIHHEPIPMNVDCLPPKGIENETMASTIVKGPLKNIALFKLLNVLYVALMTLVRP